MSGEEESIGEEEMNEELDEMEDEDFEEPEEWKETEASSSKVEEDYQKEFKVLGKEEFKTLSKINVTSQWVENATQFPAELVPENLAELTSIDLFPKKLSKKIATEIKQWFPVQISVLPSLLKDILKPPVFRPRDITISAPTGSGKTLCYVLPSLTLIGKKPTQHLSVLILVPVKTLVNQIEQEFARFNVYNANIVALSSGEDIDKEARKLKGCNVVISTPSRFIEHLMNRDSSVKLDKLRLLIVDEADRMGYSARADWLQIIERRSGGLTRATNLNDILNTSNAPRKLLLSATLSKDIEELHMWNLHRPCLFKATAKKSEQIELKNHDHVTGVLALPASIKHEFCQSEKTLHPLVIHLKLNQYKKSWKKVLIFVNEKSSALRLSILLSVLAKENYKVENLTADLFGRRREKVLKRFKNGATRVLICSDVLSRGVDVPDIDCVINYDLPFNDRLFVHRAGRTGRAGKAGSLLSIGDKGAKRRFSAMLTKTGLWNEVRESLIGDDNIEENKEEYQEALSKLQDQVANEDNVNGKTKKISGFEFKKKRKWDPELKEKREAEKMAKRVKWQKKDRQEY